MSELTITLTEEERGLVAVALVLYRLERSKGPDCAGNSLKMRCNDLLFKIRSDNPLPRPEWREAP